MNLSKILENGAIIGVMFFVLAFSGSVTLLSIENIRLALAVDRYMAVIFWTMVNIFMYTMFAWIFYSTWKDK
jgi:hypothetical protein